MGARLSAIIQCHSRERGTAVKNLLFVLAVLAVPAAGVALLFAGGAGLINRWLGMAGVPLFGIGLALCGYAFLSVRGSGPSDNAPGT